MCVLVKVVATVVVSVSLNLFDPFNIAYLLSIFVFFCGSLFVFILKLFIYCNLKGNQGLKDFFTDSASLPLNSIIMKRNLLLIKKRCLWKRVFLIHLICWLFFITYELLLVHYTLGAIEHAYIYIVYYTINISLFYASVSLLNYTFKPRQIKLLYGIASFTGLFLGYLIVKSLADFFLNSPAPTSKNVIGYTQGFFVRNIMRGFYFEVLATFYWAAGRISSFRKKVVEAERQQLLAEKQNEKLENLLIKSRNAYLQQQINPHMLFNALNFVYNSAQKYSEDAAQCIWLLAEIMRFSLEDADADGKINLERETEQIKNLLAINRYRYNEPLEIDVKMAGDFKRFKIIPLILLTLTENIFKHGNLTEAEYPAMLSLTTNESGQLIFFSRNLKRSKNGHPRRRQQLGLENVRIRMDSVYGNRYQLDIAEPGKFFELTLKIDLCA